MYFNCFNKLWRGECHISLCTAICLHLKTVTEIEECVFVYLHSTSVSFKCCIVKIQLVTNET